MSNQLTRERARVAALHNLAAHASDPRVRELAQLARDAEFELAPPVASAVDRAPARADRAERRRARTARTRRRQVALITLVVALLAGATLVSTAALASSNPAPNSVVPVGRAPHLGAESGLALRAGVVGIAGDPAGPGYWLVGADGGVFAFGRAPFFGSLGNTTLNAPIVGIAPTADGKGYWLAGSDGGVFAFGNATFEGSMGGWPLTAPITAIVPTRDGHGYWLVGKDGGVFSFGSARYHGSTSALGVSTAIVGAATTNTGHGYWLLGSDGGVFAFGDAQFFGAQPEPGRQAVGIAPDPRGRGYWIAYSDGGVSGFGAPLTDGAAMFDPGTPHPNTVAISSSTAAATGSRRARHRPVSTIADDPFLACTRAHESDSAGGYQAVSAGGTYRGAYQFDQGTWNTAADLAGRSDLVGVDPAAAAPADQDLLAITLYHARGSAPVGRPLLAETLAELASPRSTSRDFRAQVRGSRATASS